MTAFGYFDNENGEYVIQRPDTPRPWMNYLGQGGMSGIISQTGGGVSFFADPQYLRILRYRVNSRPEDRPGRYIYIRDMADGEYWSATWAPVLKGDDFECRHGMGYTRISQRHKEIASSTRYFVPPGADHELWELTLANEGETPRTLRIFSYCEFSHYKAIIDFLHGWSRMSFSCECRDGTIFFEPLVERSHTAKRVFHACDHATMGYDCGLDAFIGGNRSEANPVVVETGNSGNRAMSADFAVGSLCVEVTLQPGERKTVRFMLGVAESDADAAKIVSGGFEEATVKKQFEDLRGMWDNRLAHFQVKSPDPHFDLWINRWNQYQCAMTFLWSRFISYDERGMDRGLGYRDSMQDVLGIMSFDPETARERILMLLKLMFRRGDAKDKYFPFVDQAEGGGRSDDHLWGVYAVRAYVEESGNLGFLETSVPYVDGGEGTVLEHLEAALHFSLKTTGRNGLPLMLKADWNDSLAPVNVDGTAESGMVFFQLGRALHDFSLLCIWSGLTEKAEWADAQLVTLKEKAADLWDGGWFVRGFDCSGKAFGSHKNKYGQIYLNAQTWAVLSGLATPERGREAMDNAGQRLHSDFGLKLLDPPGEGMQPEHGAFTPFPAGSRENGGIFHHTNPWAVIAEILLGRPDTAYAHYARIMPPNRNDAADICGVEPYVLCQNMLGPDHARFGRGYNSWLSGTSAWSWVAATQYILGIRATLQGLEIVPAIPSDWPGYSVIRRFRGLTVHIKVRRAGNGEKMSMTVGGAPVEGSLVEAARLRDCSRIEVVAKAVANAEGVPS